MRLKLRGYVLECEVFIGHGIVLNIFYIAESFFMPGTIITTTALFYWVIFFLNNFNFKLSSIDLIPFGLGVKSNTNNKPSFTSVFEYSAACPKYSITQKNNHLNLLISANIVFPK
jgi:hypothetical protein